MVVRYQRRTRVAPIVGTLPVADAFTFSLGGKTPKGAIFRMTSGTVLGTALTPARLSEGCTDGTTHRAIGLMSESGPAAGSTDSGYLQDTATVLQHTATTTEARDAECEWVSFAADTVNVRWPDLPSGACVYECEVVYGDDAVCKVKDYSGVASLTGGSDFFDVTGVGFAYGHLHSWSAFVLAAADDSGANARISIGFSAYQAQTGVLQQSFMTHEDRDRPSTNIQCVQRIGDNGIAKRFLIGTTGTVTDGGRIEVTSVSSDGFRITTRDVAEVVNGFCLAVKTGLQRVWCGIPAAVVPAGGGAAGVLKTSATGTHLVRDPGFLASDVHCLATQLNTANSNVSASLAGHFSHGGSDGTTPVVSSYKVEQNATTSNSHSVISAGFVRVLKNDASDDWVAALVLGDSLGFGVNVTTASAADRQAAFLVLSEQLLLTPTPATIALSEPAVARLLTEVPTPAHALLQAPAVARLLTELPTPAHLGLAAAAVARLLTELPAPAHLQLVAATVARLLTEVPTPVALPVLAPVVSRLVAEVPAPVHLALVAATVARLLTELPAPAHLALSVQAVVRLLTEVPAPALLALSAPAVTRTLTEFPTPAHLPLLVPIVTQPGFIDPMPVELRLAAQAVARLLTEVPTPAHLALLAAPVARLATELAAPVHLPLAVPTPLGVTASLAPLPVVLLVRAPAPTLGLVRVLLLLEAELALRLDLEARAALALGLEAELALSLELRGR